jgi:cytidine deaminase
MVGRIELDYIIYPDVEHLSSMDKELVQSARLLTEKAYAPYSLFKVAAIARMTDNQFVHGTNQENASYPIGLCAERVLLAAVSSICPDTAIETMAITYASDAVDDTKPVAPCGICRQSLVEFESRFSRPLRLLLTGKTGQVFEIHSASDLLPFAFKSVNLGK